MRRLLVCGIAAAILLAGYRQACAFEIVEDIAAEVGISKQVVEEIKNGLTQLKQLQTELQSLQADLQLVEQCHLPDRELRAQSEPRDGDGPAERPWSAE